MTPAPAAKPLAGITIRLVAVALLAIMFALVKLASEHNVHLVEPLFYRQALAIPLMVLVVARSAGLASLRTNRPGAHAVRMALGLSGMACNFLGMIMLPLADATVIGFSVPLFATLLAIPLLRELPGRWRLIALSIGFVGVAIVVNPSPQTWHSTGTLIAIVGALITALVTIQLRNLGKTEAAPTIVFWFTLTSMAPLGLLMFWFAQAHDIIGWALIGGISITGALAQWALTESLRIAPIAVVLPMDYTSLIWATGFGWLVFNQLPTITALIGAPLIITSGLIILWREQRRHSTVSLH